MAAIPWNAIIASLPALIEQAGKLFRTADQPAPALSAAELAGMSGDEKIQLLTERVERLEKIEAEQAKLVQEALQALQDVSVRAAALQARATAAVIVSAVALIASASALLR